MYTEFFDTGKDAGFIAYLSDYKRIKLTIYPTWGMSGVALSLFEDERRTQTIHIPFDEIKLLFEIMSKRNPDGTERE